MIIFSVFVIIVVFFMVTHLRADKEKMDQSSDEHTKKMWKMYVNAIENEHFLYPLTSDLRNWVLSNQEFGWTTLDTSMPKEIRHQFGVFIIEHTNK